jgi:outer membrane protein assembly factor BamB
MRTALTLVLALGAGACFGQQVAKGSTPTAEEAAKPNREWNQWGGGPSRNNTPEGTGIATEWEVGDFDFTTGKWDRSSSKNILWASKLGSQTYGNVVVADGKAFVGTNNSGGWLKRYPSDVDLGVLLCFDIKKGRFLWQHSSEKLKTGRVHDWPLQGICCSPYVEGDRLWFVTSRGEVRCLDTEGFHDEENDGPVTDEGYAVEDEADVIWVYDMMRELGVSQHNMCSCSVTAIGDTLLVITGNGVDESHINLPGPEAPSFLALDKNTGKVLWTDASPGLNILHGQWSSPACGMIKMPDGSEQMQAIFPGGDGWVYGVDPAGDGKGGAKILWRFDANPKESLYTLGGRATRNTLIGTPVLYENRVYIAVGEDPEHGEGVGHLWCIDPTKSGDVSPELAYSSKDPKTPIAHRRIQAVIADEGDFARPNPNSAVVWHFSEEDFDGDGEVAFEETMHRTIGTVAIKDDILYIADFSGLFHCIDAETGKQSWVYDMFAASWGSAMIVEGKVYMGDEDGDVAIFRHSADPKVAMKDDGGEMVPHFGEVSMGNSVYSTPIVADNVLYISNRTHLFAIQPEGSEADE